MIWIPARCGCKPSCKAAEGSRTPRRFANFVSRLYLRQVVECGCPLPLLNGDAGLHFADSAARQSQRSANQRRHSKAAEGSRTPRPVGDTDGLRNSRNVVECGCPLPLCNLAYIHSGLESRSCHSDSDIHLGPMLQLTNFPRAAFHDLSAFRTRSVSREASWSAAALCRFATWPTSTAG